MSALLDNLKARFGALVQTMSERDRRLFVGLVVCGAVLSVGGIVWVTRSSLADANSRVAERKASLAQVEELAAQQTASSAEAARIEEELKRRSGEDLPAFMEKAAQRAGVNANLAAVREKEVSTQGNLEEKRYGVEINKVTTAQLAGMLHAVETDGYPLRVRAMKTRTVAVAGQKLLNVTLEVSAFRLVADAATPDGKETP
jgi:hypothetical protein